MTITATRLPGICGSTRRPLFPDASVINWPGAGYTRANGSAVAVSPDLAIGIYNGSASPTDVVVDVLGYYR